jgi:transposase InsO family protein
MGLLQPRKRKGQRWTRPLVVHPSISNTYWEMDLTYVWCGIQQGYLFPVIDAYDRGIPGYCFGGRCRALEAAEALEMAVLSRFKGREAARVLGVQLEYAGIQCPDDKPYIESFIGKYKTEEVYRNEYFGLAQALQGWKSYRTWYETERLNQALGYRTPKQVLRDSKTFRTRDYNLSRAHFGPK